MASHSVTSDIAAVAEAHPARPALRAQPVALVAVTRCGPLLAVAQVAVLCAEMVLVHADPASTSWAKNRAHGIDESSVVLLLSSCTFDPHLGDTLATLAAGACLVVPEKNVQESFLNPSSAVKISAPLSRGSGHEGETHRDGGESEVAAGALFESVILRGCRVTHCQTTPSLWQNLVGGEEEVRGGGRHRLRTLALGGESMARFWPIHGSYETLLNTYGVTECYCYQSFQKVRRVEDASLIGTPFEGNMIELWPLLGTYGGPLEIVVGGAQVGEYYDRNKNWRLDCDYGSTRAEKSTGIFYRTGDIGETIRCSGEDKENGNDGSTNIRIKGRADWQVKLGGVRVELEEIEEKLMGPKSRVPLLLVRGEAARVLPPAWVPRDICLLTEMPMTSNGKVDRKALAEHQRLSVKRQGAPPSGCGGVPKTPAEKEIAEIWAAELGVDAGTLEPSDNFFHLGADSLAALRVCRRLVARFATGQEHVKEELHQAPHRDARPPVLSPPPRAAQSATANGNDGSPRNVVVRAAAGAPPSGLSPSAVAAGSPTSSSSDEEIHLLTGSAPPRAEQPPLVDDYGTIFRQELTVPFLLANPVLRDYARKVLGGRVAPASGVTAAATPTTAAPASSAAGGEEQAGDAEDADERLQLLHSAVHFKLCRFVDVLLQTRFTEMPPRVAPPTTTPLHVAAQRGYGEIVALLLANGNTAKMTTQPDPTGVLPLHFSKNAGIVSLLLGGGVGGGSQLREDATTNGSGSAPSSGQNLLTARDRNRQCLLHFLARRGDAETLKAVLDGIEPSGDSGIKIRWPVLTPRYFSSRTDWRDKWHRTPLAWAVLNENDGCVRVLLDHGANADAKVRDRAHKKQSHLVNESARELAARVGYGEKLREMEREVEMRKKFAEVTLWQFFAKRHREPAPNQRNELPLDTHRIIYEFLGPVDFGGEVLSGRKLKDISRSARLNDTALAAAYYIDLAAAAARSGLHEVTITEDIFNAAPKLASAGGDPIPMDVIAQVLEPKGYEVMDGDEREYGGPADEDGEKFDPEAFPMTIIFGTALDAYYEEVRSNAFHATSSKLRFEMMHRLSGPGPVGASCGSVSGPGYVATSSDPQPGGPEVGAFIKTMERAIKKAAEAVEQKICESFASGAVQWDLTDEIWEKMEQKLPNGKPVPFFESDLKSSFKTHGPRNYLPERLTVCESLRAGIGKRGVLVWPKWILVVDDEEERRGPRIASITYGFPVEFKMKDFA
eukprot:g16328.t1